MITSIPMRALRLFWSAVVVHALTAGSVVAADSVKIDTGYRIGDSYAYRTMDLFSRAEDVRYTLRATELADDRVVFNGGRRVTDRWGNDISVGDGARFSGQQLYPAEYAVGRQWRTQYELTHSNEIGRAHV